MNFKLQCLEKSLMLSFNSRVLTRFKLNSQLSANKSYNSLLNLVFRYGGPDTSFVTKQWNVDWGTSLVSRYGIAVARIDGRGSSLRGVDHMFALNRRLGTVEIEDQITVTR